MSTKIICYCHTRLWKKILIVVSGGVINVEDNLKLWNWILFSREISGVTNRVSATTVRGPTHAGRRGQDSFGSLVSSVLPPFLAASPEQWQSRSLNDTMEHNIKFQVSEAIVPPRLGTKSITRCNSPPLCLCGRGLHCSLIFKLPIFVAACPNWLDELAYCGKPRYSVPPAAAPHLPSTLWREGRKESHYIGRKCMTEGWTIQKRFLYHKEALLLLPMPEIYFFRKVWSE